MAAKLGELGLDSTAKAPTSRRAALQLLQQTLALAAFLSFLDFAFAEGAVVAPATCYPSMHVRML